jgi:hypothetical protein
MRFNFAFVCATLCSLAGCSHFVLEAREVLSLKTNVTDGATLHICGSTDSSMNVVKGYAVSYSPEEASLLIDMIVTDTRLSGTFDIALQLPPKVNRVYFGRNRVLIWQRGQTKRDAIDY